MIYAFIANGNTLREVVELLGHVCFNPHSVFHVIFLLVGLHSLLITLHPFTGIEQVIYRWKAAVSTQVSRVDHLFILATILKVFYLKFIQIVVELPCVFTLNFCDVFSFVIFSSIRQCYTNNIPFVQTFLTIIFLTFSDRGLELTQMIFLSF